MANICPKDKTMNFIPTLKQNSHNLWFSSQFETIRLFLGKILLHIIILFSKYIFRRRDIQSQQLPLIIRIAQIYRIIISMATRTYMQDINYIILNTEYVTLPMLEPFTFLFGLPSKN